MENWESVDFSRSFQSAWTFTRGLTRDLLTTLSTEDLLFVPGPGMGALWKQFRHVGRVQECYMEALTTRRINFTPEGKSYDGGPQKEWLIDYLDRLDDGLFDLLRRDVDWTSDVDWFEEKVNLFEHLMRLESHETLHHGQWIVYLKLMNRPFPESWAAWGV